MYVRARWGCCHAIPVNFLVEVLDECKGGGTYENSQNREKVWHAEWLYFPVLDCALQFETAEVGFCGEGPGGFVSFRKLEVFPFHYLRMIYRSHS